MSYILPILLALTFLTSSPSLDKIDRGPVWAGAVVKPDPIDDRACLAPCRIDGKGDFSCGCGRVRPKS